MADTKFTGLTAITNPLGNDILPIVDDPDGTPVSRKIKVGNLIEGGFTTTATAAGTTTLTDASTKIQEFTGSTTQTIVLPNATTLSVGRTFTIHNNSTGAITINTNGGSQLTILSNLSSVFVTLTNNGTAAGTWDIEPSHEITENVQTSANSNSHSTDTYLPGSYVKFPISPLVGTTYKLTFDVTKTAAGTATPIINIRIGTAGTTADTARNTFTFGAGTAAADTGVFEVIVVFRAVGTTSARTQAIASLRNNLTTTGISNNVKARTSTSGTFDSTTAALGIGASYNGGTSANHTVTLCRAEVIM